MHARLIDNLRLGMSVFLNGTVRDAQKLLEEKARFRDLEREYATSHLARLELNLERPVEPLFEPAPQMMFEQHADPEGMLTGADQVMEMRAGPSPVTVSAQGALPLRSQDVDPNDPATWGNTGRNASCPCGSGKKFKHCHGRVG